MRILWITPKWTLPVTDGARVATDSLIRNVVLAGGDVDYWSLSNQDDLPDTSHMIHTWGVTEASFNVRNLPSSSLKKKCYYLKKLLTSPLTPLTFSSFTDKSFLKTFTEKLSKKNYDFIVLDGLHLGVLLKDASPSILKKVIYRAHNIEADLWYKSYESTTNLLLKAFFWLQYKLVQKFEIDLARKVGGVAAISQEDFDILRFFGANVSLVPLGLKFRDLPAPPLHEITKFSFVGRLDWPPNRDGLKWLLDEVWPEVMKKRTDAKLSIFGSGDSSWLKNYRSMNSVEVVGFIPQIIDAYKESHFTLVPVFYGSGTRIKVIESFAMNRRLISTNMGVQGAGLSSQDYIRAEAKEDWINTLSEIKVSCEDQQQLEQSIKRLRIQFDEVEIARKFYQWLKDL